MVAQSINIWKKKPPVNKSTESLNNDDSRGTIEDIDSTGNAYRIRFRLQRLGKQRSHSNGKDVFMTIGKSTVRLVVLYSVRQEIPQEDY
jgi:hypothetical protein